MNRKQFIFGLSGLGLAGLISCTDDKPKRFMGDQRELSPSEQREDIVTKIIPAVPDVKTFFDQQMERD